MLPGNSPIFEFTIQFSVPSRALQCFLFFHYSMPPRRNPLQDITTQLLNEADGENSLSKRSDLERPRKPKHKLSKKGRQQLSEREGKIKITSKKRITLLQDDNFIAAGRKVFCTLCRKHVSNLGERISAHRKTKTHKKRLEAKEAEKQYDIKTLEILDQLHTGTLV